MGKTNLSQFCLLITGNHLFLQVLDFQTVNHKSSNAKVNGSPTKISDGVKTMFSMIRQQTGPSNDPQVGRSSEPLDVNIDVADGVGTKNIESSEVFVDTRKTEDNKMSEETEIQEVKKDKSSLSVPEDKSRSRNNHASDSSELSLKDGKKKVARRVVSESSMQVHNKVSS